MSLPLGLTHGVVHSGALLLPLLRAVRADGGLANLHLVILSHVLVMNCASLHKFLIALLLLVRLKMSDVGGVASLLVRGDAGQLLRVVGVFCQQ